MKSHFRILVFLIATPAVLAACGQSAGAGGFFREGGFLSLLERNHEQSLPTVVTRAQSPSYETSGQYVTQAGGEAEMYYADSCGDLGCSDPACHACQSCEDDDWLDDKTRTLNRKAYFNHNRSHKHFLYPVCRPYCQPGFGIYDTCWRRIQPNYCACQEQPSAYNHAVPQAPAAGPNGQGQGVPPYDNTPPAPYQR